MKSNGLYGHSRRKEGKNITVNKYSFGFLGKSGPEEYLNQQNEYAYQLPMLFGGLKIASAVSNVD
jgi:hypothetical protein